MICTPNRLAVRLSIATAALFSTTVAVDAQSPGREGGLPVTPSIRTTNRPVSPDPSPIAAGHPLLPVIEYAHQEHDYLRRTIRDFTCRLIKRERIDGILQDHQYIDMWVREEVRQDGRVVVPFSIYMHFLAPRKIAGRRVLYVDGRNDGKLKVRNGGKHFDYVVVDIDPYGETAMDESLVPVTQCGFGQILAQMIAVLERHAAADPTGQNTQVLQIKEAKLNERPCNVIRITHAASQPGLEFHQANVFVDDELHVPVRVDYLGWPRRGDRSPQLNAEYTYTKLQVNTRLSDSTFSPQLLRDKSAR